MKKKKVKVIDHIIVVAEFKSSLFYKPFFNSQETRREDLEGKLNLRNELNEKFYGVHERDGAYKFFNLTIPGTYKLYLEDTYLNYPNFSC